MNLLKFAKIYNSAVLPTRNHSTDAGIDLYFYDGELDEYSVGRQLDIPGNSIFVANTGVTVEIPDGYFGWITNKSRSDFLIGGGIVDSGYQGELLVKIINPVDTPVTLSHGKAIAQLLIIPCVTPPVEEVPQSDIHQVKTERSTAGGIVGQEKVKHVLQIQSGKLGSTSKF